jgi:RNA polymerase sigma-70 factor, ECF subfamily
VTNIFCQAVEESIPHGQPYPATDNFTRRPRSLLSVPDDAELIRRIGRRDETAFRALVDRHAPYLHGIAYSLTGNRADAEDVVQETFVGVLNSTFRGESQVRTWLVQILVRRVAMLRRTRRRKPAERLKQESAPATRPKELAGAEARLDLAAMLEHLSPEHREVIVLREVQQMSYEEMAATLNVPRGTIESRLHRARNELRERFKGYLTR